MPQKLHQQKNFKLCICPNFQQLALQVLCKSCGFTISVDVHSRQFLEWKKKQPFSLNEKSKLCSCKTGFEAKEAKVPTYDGQWLGIGWETGRFRHQRTAVQFKWSAKFYAKLIQFKRWNKEKRDRKWSWATIKSVCSVMYHTAIGHLNRLRPRFRSQAHHPHFFIYSWIFATFVFALWTERN